MAGISTDARGNRKIQFIDRTKERKILRLGKIPMRAAQAILLRIESLLTANRFQVEPDPATVEWINGLQPAFAKRLAHLGLIAKRPEADEKELNAFIAEYISSRIDVKYDTKTVWSQAQRNLTAFFGPRKSLRDITEGEADEFKMYLIEQGLSTATVHKWLQSARMFFRAAKRKKLVTQNPFEDVRATVVIDRSRHVYVSRETIGDVLEVCDRNWRLIVTLCRFAGLRCPSEVLSLRWEDIDWNGGRIVITSPKTEHHEGKDSRQCPLFPEVRTELEKALPTRSEGAVYVVESYRQHCNTAKGWRQANLRTQFERILKRVGAKQWPRLFHGMRASCETDLLQEFPSFVVSAWLGHSVAIQERHYATVRDEDFARASGTPTQSAPQSGAISTIPESPGESISPQNLPRIAGNPAKYGTFSRKRVGVTGFEPVTSSV